MTTIPLTLGRRMGPLKITLLVVADTSLLRTRTGSLVFRRLDAYIFELNAIGKWVTVRHDPA